MNLEERICSYLLIFVAGFVVGAIFMDSSIKEEVVAGMVTFPGAAWVTKKIDLDSMTKDTK
jgi:hypothetical protein